VRPFIQSSAEEDLLRQVEWYAEKGLPDIAMRFRDAVREAINAPAATPGAGTPKHSPNPQLTGLRTWPVGGFEDFRVYYQPHTDIVIVLRILHGKRDIGRILAGQTLEDPSP
jgi:plasmid stabilization system protein ParE